MKKAITVGVFDLLHLGHLRMLEKSKSLCDFLTVAVHDDKLNIKDIEFVYSLEERKEMVNALCCVDSVISYERVDLLLPTLDFDIFLYGPDQNHQYFQKALQWCKKNNKEIYSIKRTQDISSTKIRNILNISNYYS